MRDILIGALIGLVLMSFTTNIIQDIKIKKLESYHHAEEANEHGQHTRGHEIP